MTRKKATYDMPVPIANKAFHSFVMYMNTRDATTSMRLSIPSVEAAASYVFRTGKNSIQKMNPTKTLIGMASPIKNTSA